MRAKTRLALAAILLGAAAPPDGQELDLAGLVPIEDEILAEQRGGLAVDGMEISLGADIRTYLDGELVLQTIVSWTKDSATTTQTVSGALTPADAQTLSQGVLSTGSITMRVGGASVFLANGGQTALLHRTDGPIQNILVNTASRTSLTQQMDANIAISGFGEMTAAAAQTQLLSQLGAAIDTAALTAVAP